MKVLGLLLVFWLIPNLSFARDISVLEIDTGADVFSHSELSKYVNPDFNGNLNYTDQNSHGTHVAGIVLKDVCSQVRFYACNFKIYGYLSCLRYAIWLHPQFINISAGGYNFDFEEMLLVEQLSNLGVTIVAAVGNDHKDLKYSEYYPACYNFNNIIPVGSLDNKGNISKFSNYGLSKEVYEPGENFYSTLPNGKYGYKSGTSMATAYETNLLLKQECKNNL